MAADVERADTEAKLSAKSELWRERGEAAGRAV